MATIKIKISVSELANVLTLYDQIKVYRSTTGIDGTYTEITGAGTRINLSQGTSSYEFDDTSGDALYWYRTSYFNSNTSAESAQGTPKLGDVATPDLVMTVDEMKTVYLFGLDLTNDAGEPFPDLVFEWGLRWAVSWLEHKLDIRINPTELTERYDYWRQDYQNWMTIQLRERPIVSVDEVAVTWPSDVDVIVFPDAWIRPRLDAGQVNIVPTAGTLAQSLLTAGGTFMPLVASGLDFVPDVIRVTYTAGFPKGEVPMAIRDAVGKLAAFGPLNIAGDLIVGAGIASKTVSIDGLSQSINTTSSATNAGYGARLVQYTKELKDVMPTLQRYYKGIRMGVV
jgi:hypothetical protein